MKTVKRITSLLLLLSVLLGLFALNASAAPDVILGECGDALTWRYTVSTGELVISGTGPMWDFYSGSQPWSHLADGIKSVVINKGVTSIGASAFTWLENVTVVNMPDTITSIGAEAFLRLGELKEISLSTNLKVLGEGCFYGSGLKSVTIPNQIEHIADYAFQSCGHLTYVKLNDGLKSIGVGSFSGTGVTAVVFPNSVTTIGNSAFGSCENLTSIVLGNSVKTMGSCVFERCTSLTAAYFPDSLTECDYGTFYRCYSLKEVRLSPNMKDLPAGMFEYCTALKNVNIPAGVENILGAAFDSTGLCNVVIPSTVKKIEPNAFWNSNNLYHVLYTGSRTQWNSVVNDIDPLTSALKHYNATGNEVVTKTGTAGYGEYVYCTLCQLALSCEHKNVELYDKKEATCKQEGYSGDMYCLDCDECLLVGETVKKADHSYENDRCKFCGAEDPVKIPFTDVKKSDYYAQPVLWAVEKNITTGTGNGKFSPEKTCTRGQVVTFLWRAAGSPEPKSTNNPFTDIKAKDYYYKAVLWAVEKGITSGTGKGKFSPDNECTRAQVATFLWRAQGEPKPTSIANSFNDVAQSSYYYKAVLWAVEKGITNGTGKGKFSPDNSCTRGQIVTFLYRALG